ncbi:MULTISPECIES: hypothetical protein [Niastella]|uniref:Uncharacterized protein n=1 Tax=Niastella soli TaxID=2821487 RepID=A0ABS3Z237_9BACT|nr:hypothetical protein [Niastella soli]MBO9204226.1 hypothetical protein [Niastella soli]
MSNIAFKHPIAATHTERRSNTLTFSNFIKWCSNQQENRFSWLAIAIAGHGCVLTPLTVMAVVNSGNNLILFMIAILAMAMVLITNLAALPTKITIPFLFSSILIDLGILLACGLL